MKSRFGYVSNSSSSSFCVVGIVLYNECFDENIVDGIRKRLVEEVEDIDEEDIKSEDTVEVIKMAFDYLPDFDFLEMTRGISDYYDQTILGFDIRRMKDDQTLGSIKDEVFAKLVQAGFTGKRDDIKMLLDGGYDG